MKPASLLIIFLMVSQAAFSQIIVIKGDTIQVTEDTIRFIVPDFRGEINWHWSNDGVIWFDVENSSDTLLLESYKENYKFYRAKITDINCAPVFSDTIIYNDINLDREALIAIYQTTKGSAWKNNTNWCSDKPLSEWHGITTENGRVTKLDLRMNNLSGLIPKETGSLKRLEYLDLSYNNLTGSIPPEIGKLPNLKELQIRNMSTLDGTLPPEIGKLKKLEIMNLSMNSLSGPIPEEIGNLSCLKSLVLGSNKFSGSMPASLEKLNLEFINLDDNDLEGMLPDYIVKWFTGKDGYYTKKMWLSSNNFSGALPATIVQHPDFIYNYPGFIVQKPDYGFPSEGLNINIPQFIVKDTGQNTINFEEECKKNTLTAYFGWSPSCGWSDMLAGELIEFYESYKSKGFEVIGFAFEHNVGYHSENDLLNYISNRQLQWRNFICKGSVNIGYTNSFPLYTHYAPNLYLVDGNGTVIWNRLLEKDINGYKKLLKEYFGESTRYESSDYSQDGIVSVLQVSAVNSGNNLVIIGDGFSDKHTAPGGLYDQRMNEALNHFFSVEPMKSYRKYFNVYSVKTVSKNENFLADSETALGTLVPGCGTAIHGDYTKVMHYAGRVPGVNLLKTPVIVILNSPVYAGTCHYFSDGSTIAYVPVVAYDSLQFGAIVHHEAVGHAFGRLLDEYFYNSSTIPPEYADEFYWLRKEYSAGYNLTLDMNDVPWDHFLWHPEYPETGLFEGGYFYRYGVWRPEEKSCMINNIPYFNGPSRELMVKRIKEQAGEPYIWEEFVKNDKQELPQLKSLYTDFTPLPPPQFHNHLQYNPVPEKKFPFVSAMEIEFIIDK
jgi:hypothetical protein